MIHGFADICTYVYVIVDDLYQTRIAIHDHRPGPRSVCSESEIIALTLIAELTGQDEEGPFVRYLRRNHLTLFPAVPERTRYNRRRRCLTEVTNRLRRALLERLLVRLDPSERTLWRIDSLPIPVVGFNHARGSHRWYGEACAGWLPHPLAQRRHAPPTEAARSQRTETLCPGVVSQAPSTAFERG